MQGIADRARGARRTAKECNLPIRCNGAFGYLSYHLINFVIKTHMPISQNYCGCLLHFCKCICKFIICVCLQKMHNLHFIYAKPHDKVRFCVVAILFNYSSFFQKFLKNFSAVPAHFCTRTCAIILGCSVIGTGIGACSRTQNLTTNN